MKKAAEVPQKVLMVVTPVIAAGVFTVSWAAYRFSDYRAGMESALAKGESAASQR